MAGKTQVVLYGEILEIFGWGCQVQTTRGRRTAWEPPIGEHPDEGQDVFEIRNFGGDKVATSTRTTEPNCPECGWEMVKGDSQFLLCVDCDFWTTYG